jgi:integrase
MRSVRRVAIPVEHGSWRQRFVATKGDKSPRCVFDRYATGQRWDPNELSRQWTRLVQRKKLPRLRFHDLRHGNACLILQAGGTLDEVTEALRHSSQAVTRKYYARYEEGLKRKRAAALDALLEETARKR